MYHKCNLFSFVYLLIKNIFLLLFHHFSWLLFGAKEQRLHFELSQNDRAP